MFLVFLFRYLRYMYLSIKANHYLVGVLGAFFTLAILLMNVDILGWLDLSKDFFHVC
jgi:hypothetical protein